MKMKCRGGYAKEMKDTRRISLRSLGVSFDFPPRILRETMYL